MIHRQSKTVAMLVAGIMLAAVAAWALPAFVKTFNDTYKISKTSTLGKAGCAVCHPSKTNTKTLNAYGKQLSAEMKEQKTKKLTPEVLKAVEGMDADKDGKTNIAEIKADTLPGDAASHP